MIDKKLRSAAAERGIARTDDTIVRIAGAAVPKPLRAVLDGRSDAPTGKTYISLCDTIQLV